MGRAAVIAALCWSLIPGLVEAADCPDDSVRSGTVCIDKYEASLWHVAPGQKTLIGRIQNGTVRLDQLIAGGAVQVGVAENDFASTGCSPIGNGCVNVYAVSISGVMPSTLQTWLQAVAAARNSLKRLPTNQEWQAAVMGTPDGSPCIVNSALPAQTGSAPGCVSDIGAFDMVGNVAEHVAEWGDSASSCQAVKFGLDRSCFAGPGTQMPALPRVYARGGDWDDNTDAGPLAIDVTSPAALVGPSGFRGVR